MTTTRGRASLLEGWHMEPTRSEAEAEPAFTRQKPWSMKSPKDFYRMNAADLKRQRKQEKNRDR